MSVASNADFVHVDWPSLQQDLSATNEKELQNLEEHYCQLYTFAKEEVEVVCARVLGKIAMTEETAGNLLSCCYRLNEIEQGYEGVKEKGQKLFLQVREVTPAKLGGVQTLIERIETLYIALRHRNVALKKSVAPPKTLYNTIVWGYDPSVFEQYCLKHFVKRAVSTRAE